MRPETRKRMFAGLSRGDRENHGKSIPFENCYQILARSGNYAVEKQTKFGRFITMKFVEKF